VEGNPEMLLDIIKVSKRLAVKVAYYVSYLPTWPNNFSLNFRISDASLIKYLAIPKTWKGGTRTWW